MCPTVADRIKTLFSRQNLQQERQGSLFSLYFRNQVRAAQKALVYPPPALEKVLVSKRLRTAPPSLGDTTPCNAALTARHTLRTWEQG